jgi:hypothetical protein
MIMSGLCFGAASSALCAAGIRTDKLNRQAPMNHAHFAFMRESPAILRIQNFYRES